MKQLAIVAVLAIAALFVGTAYAHFGFGGHMGPAKFDSVYNKTNITESLGLPANASVTDIRIAVKEKREAEINDMLARAKQKLGLPSTATDDELKTALNSWTEQNRDILGAMRYSNGMHGFPVMHRRW